MKNTLENGLNKMKLIKQKVVHLTPDDEKGNYRIPFTVDEKYKKLFITYSYYPKILEDEEKSRELIKENLIRDAGEDADKYTDYSEFMPLKNLITPTLESPEGIVGAAHRHGNEQYHEIGKEFASVGFEKCEIIEGQWCLVLNIHAVVTDSVRCEIRIEAEEETL